MVVGLIVPSLGTVGRGVCLRGHLPIKVAGLKWGTLQSRCGRDVQNEFKAGLFTGLEDVSVCHENVTKWEGLGPEFIGAGLQYNHTTGDFPHLATIKSKYLQEWRR